MMRFTRISGPNQRRRLVSGLFAVLFVAVTVAPAAETRDLPEPVVNQAGFALLANSRYSVMSGFLTELSEQVLANVVWAMDHAPMLGETREFYVATPDNLYRYESAERRLSLYRPGDLRYSSGSAFEVGVAASLAEDAGSAVQAGLLAATAFREETGASACPMTWAADHANATWEPGREILMTVVFGRAEARALDTTVAVRSVDPGLVEPVTTEPDSFEIVLMGLRQDTLFAPWELSRETVSQLLWAAAGPTPHRTIDGRPGLTIPGGFAGYPHAVELFLVRQDGVARYRVEEAPERTRRGPHMTHRLETLSGFDQREELRNAVPVPVTAPAWFVVTLPDAEDQRARQEVGIVAFQLLTQARALGLAGRLVGPLNRVQGRAVSRVLNLPPDQVPVLAFAVGEALGDGEASADEMTPQPGAIEIVRARPVLRRGERVRIDFLVRVPGAVRVEVFDMLGRPVRNIHEARLTAGLHSVEWDGTGLDGNRVKPGSYVIGIFGPAAVAQHKLSVL